MDASARSGVGGVGGGGGGGVVRGWGVHCGDGSVGVLTYSAIC